MITITTLITKILPMIYRSTDSKPPIICVNTFFATYFLLFFAFVISWTSFLLYFKGLFPFVINIID